MNGARGMSNEQWPDQTLRDLARGQLDSDAVQVVQSTSKDPTRFGRVRELERSLRGEPDLVLPLQEHLALVRVGQEIRVRCDCGFDFGQHTRNWKLSALVFERDPQDGQILPAVRSADSDWMMLREFYCPGCQAQLEVEALPPGHPFVFSALPQLRNEEL